MKAAPTVRLEPDALSALAAAVRGELIAPDAPAYDEARRVYNGMIDRYPALIVRCRDTADVVAAVRFARDRGLSPSIRGGGHNAGGLGVADDAVVIDLSALRGVQVDPDERTVRVAGGSVWGDVDHATHAFGLAVPSGIISTTGVGGLTLGGGLGHLTRRYGLTIDNLLEAEVVLADGRVVRADADEHPELFWALRGGGGNFGVVTSFVFRAHPLSTVVAGPMLWEADQASEALRVYRQVFPGAPEDLNGFFAFLEVPPAPTFPEALHGRTMCGVVWCITADEARAQAWLEPVRAALPPAFEHVGPMPLPALQSAFDGLYPPGLQWYWRADFFGPITDAMIAAHAEHGPRLPTGLSSMHLYPIDGAAHRVGADETAFRHRDADFSGVIVGVSPDPADAARIRDWTVAYHEALHPHGAGGAYVNFMMDEGSERVQATYGANYERLAAVKHRYDPDNLFRVNQNVPPRPGDVGGPAARPGVPLSVTLAAARAAIRNLTVEQVEREVAGGATLVDIREREELERDGVIPGSVHAPRGLLEFWAEPGGPKHRPEVFAADRRLILHCALGERSALAAHTLKRMGYRDVGHLDGGLSAWKEAGRPTERPEA